MRRPVATKPDEKPQRSIALNRRARFEYHILEELECGIALTGTEVKSLRQGGPSIEEAFAMVRRRQLYLVNANIPVYAQGNVHNHEPKRERKLLVHKKQIDSLFSQVREKGMTLVPLKLYFVGARVKVLIGLCKGKKLYDKREDKKAKDDKREIQRAMMRRR